MIDLLIIHPYETFHLPNMLGGLTNGWGRDVEHTVVLVTLSFLVSAKVTQEDNTRNVAHLMDLIANQVS